MKNTLILLLFLFPVLAFAQYPATGNKMRLGWQTTGDGLVYRDAGAPSYTPNSRNNAYMYLDTVAQRLYRYTGGAWRDLSDEKYMRVQDASVLASDVKDSLTIYNRLFVGMELSSAVGGNRGVQLPVTLLDSTYAGRVVRVSALDSSATYNVFVSSSSPDGLLVDGALATSYDLESDETVEFQLYVFDTIYQWRLISSTAGGDVTLPDSLIYGKGDPDWVAVFSENDSTIKAGNIRDDGTDITYALPEVAYGIDDSSTADVGTYGYNSATGRMAYYNGGWRNLISGSVTENYLMRADANGNAVNAGLIDDGSVLQIDSRTLRLWERTTATLPTPSLGDMVFNTDNNRLMFYNGSAWDDMFTPWLPSGSNIYFNTGKVAINTTTFAGALNISGNIGSDIGSDVYLSGVDVFPLATSMNQVFAFGNGLGDKATTALRLFATGRDILVNATGQIRDGLFIGGNHFRDITGDAIGLVAVGYQLGNGATSASYTHLFGTFLAFKKTSLNYVTAFGSGIGTTGSSGTRTANYVFTQGEEILRGVSSLTNVFAVGKNIGRPVVDQSVASATDLFAWGDGTLQTATNLTSLVAIGKRAGYGNAYQNGVMIGDSAVLDQNRQVVLGSPSVQQLKAGNHRWNVDQEIDSSYHNYVEVYDSTLNEITLKPINSLGINSDNFANADLKLTGNRTHDGGGYSLTLDTISEFIVVTENGRIFHDGLESYPYMASRLQTENNLQNGTEVYRHEIIGKRNGGLSTLARIQAFYEGDSTTRNTSLQFGVAEQSAFGSANLKLITFGNEKYFIAGDQLSTYTSISDFSATNMFVGDNSSSPVLGVDNDSKESIFLVDEDGDILAGKYGSGNKRATQAQIQAGELALFEDATGQFLEVHPDSLKAALNLVTTETHTIGFEIVEGDTALPDSLTSPAGVFNKGYWRVPEDWDGATLTKVSFGIFDKGDMATAGAAYSLSVNKCDGDNANCSNSTGVNFTPSSDRELELSLSLTLNANDIVRVAYTPPNGCAGGCGDENVNGLTVLYTIEK